MFDTMGMTNILNNQETAQALADRLMELSKEDSVSVFSEESKLWKPTFKYILFAVITNFFDQFIPFSAQFLREMTSVYENSH